MSEHMPLNKASATVSFHGPGCCDEGALPTRGKGRFLVVAAVAFLAASGLLTFATAAHAQVVYYSVGTETAALYSFTGSAAAGVMTLDTPAADRIGVGDEVRVGAGADRYYITGRNSVTEFTIQNSAANGGTPGDTSITFGSSSLEIYRAFNLLSDAATDSLDASHLNTANLVSGGFQLNWPCYNDDAMDDTVAVTGWTTGPTNYIRIYAPFRSDEVGSPQRHTGVAGTGFRLAPVMTTTPSPPRLMIIDEEYVRLEGIEIDGTGVTNTRAYTGLFSSITLSTTSDVRIDGCIIHDMNVSDSSTTGYTHGIHINGSAAGGATARISNNLVYNVRNPFSNFVSHVVGIGIQSPGTSYVYNNTVYRIKNTGPTAFGAAWGIQVLRSTCCGAYSTTLVAKNNYVGDVTSDNDPVDNCYDQRNSGATLDQEANVSSDETAAGPGSATFMAAYATYFTDITGGSEDLHLTNDANTLWGTTGVDLDSDPNLPITEDIDRGFRDPNQPDIGADEFMAPINYRSIGTAADYITGTVTATNGSTLVTGLGTDWRAAPNRGRGDIITIDGSDYVVLTVDSGTQLQLVTPFGGTTGSGKGHTIARQFTTLQLWENCISGAGGCPASFPVASASLVADNRSEIGIAYKDSVFALTAQVLISGSATDATHTITLTAGDGNLHLGIPGQGVIVDNAGNSVDDALRVLDDFVTVEWLEIKNGGDLNSDALYIQPASVNNQIVLRNLLLHDLPQSGIIATAADLNLDAYNNIVYNTGGAGIFTQVALNAGAQVRLFNNTVVGSTSGLFGLAGVGCVTARNNLSHSNSAPDFDLPALCAASSNNLSEDGTGITHSPAAGGVTATLGQVNFVNAAGNDYHILSGSFAEDAAADLSAVFNFDIDGGGRQTPWDIGADDILATTAVELVSFTATGYDHGVLLEWETASELDNLGFHLYRATSEEGSYERITATAIPGLGSSPVGAHYSYQDSGLTNGATYYYKLEDIETTGKTEFHGPVAATPEAGTSSSREDSGDSSSDSDSGGSSSGEDRDTSVARITYGEPSANSLRVVRHGRRYVVVELLTEGFYAEPQEDGSVRLEIPGFEALSEANSPGIPVKRSWVEAIAGRKVKLVSVTARGVEAFTGLRPSDADMPEIVARRDGTVRAARRRSDRRRARAAFQGDGLYPSAAARVVSVGFQGEVKKALVELAPLRWDASRGQLLLARRLVVRLSFRGREPAELSTDGVRGRRYPRRRSHDQRGVVARLLTTERGLHAVRYEEVLRGRRGVRARALRLSRQGESVAFHLEPSAKRFKPGSTLYFLSEGASVNPYGGEAVYELELGREGDTMPEVSGAASGEPTRIYWHRAEWEENRYYQAALLDAPDVWLWDLLFAPVVKGYSFDVSALAGTSEASKLSVWLQGVSDFRANPDHHVRVYVNQSLVDEVSWDGKRAKKLDVALWPGLLREGDNLLELENVGDTEASYSMVMLDRFAVEYPRVALASDGRLEGRFHESGAAELSGLVAGTYVLDVSEARPSWLLDTEVGADGTLRFRTESDRSYLAVSPKAVYHPVVRKPKATRLKSPRHQSDYLVIGPAAFLEVAKPLLELRRNQGLTAKAVSIEDIYSEFGFGESTPQAVKDFLSYAYHNWEQPSPGYVVLLGDATYDYKDYHGTGVENQVPPLMVKTRYLWTTSDPTYAAVNGEDLLPDLAIGRLPAATVEEARVLVEKILAYETGGEASLLGGRAVLVADNADRAGNFEADAEEIASSVLASREVKKIYLSQLSRDAARSAIVEAFDEGASLMSYLGHGGIVIWASENVLNSQDVANLSPQVRQPLLLTMNCLNGYYHFPYFDSLSEALLKVEGRGAIAAFSPSGLSLNGPANLYHQALLQELFNGSHQRLGDAVLAAQVAYAATGAFPELLSIYHLLGDPALRLR